MCFDFYLSGNFSPSKDFDQIILGSQSIGSECFKINCLKIVLFNQALQNIQVDTYIFYTVDAFKSEFRNTTLQRHLSSLKSDFAAVSRTGSSTFVTTGRSTSPSGTGTTAYTFS